MAQKCPKKPKAEEFFEGLKVFDKDGYGVVLSGELRHVLTSLGKEHRTYILDKGFFKFLAPNQNFLVNSFFSKSVSVLFAKVKEVL